ncbi:hypothetical protein D3C73_1485080 [compost metagenome]
MEFRSEKSRQRRAMITVAPDARIGSNDAFHAVMTACVRLVVWVRASRNLATYRSA